MSHTRMLVCMTALAGILCLGAKSDSFVLMLGKTMPVLDAPQGAVIGQLNESTFVKVVEEKDGYFKVQIEGWIPKPAATSSAPAVQPSAAPATPPPAKPAEKKAGQNQDLKKKGQELIDLLQED